jgi:hypothetical protein
MKPRVGLVCQRNNNIPFVFDVAARHGIELIDIFARGENPQPDQIALCDRLELDVFDAPDAALDALEAWARDNRLDGVMTSREEAIVWTARAAQRLGLPGINPQAADAARNKAEARRLMQKAGCNVPAFLDYRGPQDDAALAEMDYPYVVKPKAAFGSAGVTLVTCDADRDAALAQVLNMCRTQFDRFAPETAGQGVLIESFIDGCEYVAECFAVDGVQHVVSLGFKGDPRGPFFEETVYLAPAQLPREIADRMVDEAKKGMAALGLTHGPGHCEMRLTAEGVPFILEIGARVGGSGSCHFVVEQSTGFDFFGAQLRQALGECLENVPHVPQPVAYASNYIVPLGGSGRLSRVDGLEKAEAHPDVVRLMRFLPDGTEVRPYPEFSGFIAFVFGRHDSYEAGLAQFDWLSHTIRPKWDTLDVALPLIPR